MDASISLRRALSWCEKATSYGGRRGRTITSRLRPSGVTYPAELIVESLVSAMDPASIALVTLPLSPVPTRAPVAVGSESVGVPAAAGALTVAAPLVEP